MASSFSLACIHSVSRYNAINVTKWLITMQRCPAGGRRIWCNIRNRVSSFFQIVYMCAVSDQPPLDFSMNSRSSLYSLLSLTLI
jgi:hypothetical protein